MIPVPKNSREFFELFLLFKEEGGVESMLKELDFDHCGRAQMSHVALGRLPEPQEISNSGVAPAGIKRQWQQALHSPEFQQHCIKLLLDAFPEKKRVVFIHVPKCAGTDLIANVSRNFVSVHHSLTAPAWTPKQRLFASLRDIVLALNFHSEMFVYGHFQLQYFLTHRLVRFGDHFFTVVRSPISIVISYVNYILTRFMEDRQQTLPDTREWLGMMGIQSIPNDASEQYFRELATAILHNNRAVPKNIICHYLGKGDFKSALANLKSSGTEIVDTATYQEWLKARWGIESDSRKNVSRKIISESDLTDKEREYIASITGEDQMLYNEVTAKLAASGQPSASGYDL